MLNAPCRHAFGFASVRPVRNRFPVRIFRKWVTLVIILVSASCGSNTEPVEFFDLAEAMTTQRCKGYVRCGFFADFDSCVRTLPPSFTVHGTDRAHSQVRDSVLASVILYDAAMAGECLAAIAATNCTSEAGLFPNTEACDLMFQGTRREGEPCFDNEECVNGLECWDFVPGPVCSQGACAEKRLGNSCSDRECQEGEFCNSDFACRSDLLLEQDCESRGDCPLGSVCIAGNCGPWPDSGEVCQSDCLNTRDYCGQDGTCIPRSEVGDACVDLYFECSIDSRCIEGVCVARVEEGENCFGDGTGPVCLFGLVCSGVRTGECKKPVEAPACSVPE